MYIETWQIFMMILLACSAFFSYRSGWKEGVQDGIHIVITDLHNQDIITRYLDSDGEVTIGRYDQDTDEMAKKIEEHNDN